MIVIAVNGLDVDACFSHQSSYLSELARFLLIQTLNQHLSFCDHAYARSLQRRAGRCPIVEEKVGNAFAVNDKGAAALDAYARATQRFAHLGERTRPVFQRNC